MSLGEQFDLVTTLCYVRFCGSQKWCHFICDEVETNNRYNESGKLWYLGDMLTNSGLDISYWEDHGFIELVKEMIIHKIKFGWKKDESGYNLYPNKITNEEDITKMKIAIKTLLTEHGEAPFDEDYNQDETYIEFTDEERELRKYTEAFVHGDDCSDC